MNDYLTQYADQAVAITARPELRIPYYTSDDEKEIAGYNWDTSYCMIVSAYTVAPSESADGTSLPGTLASGVWVLDSSATSASVPLQLPSGIVYITPVYAGMANPISG